MSNQVEQRFICERTSSTRRFWLAAAMAFGIGMPACALRLFMWNGNAPRTIWLFVAFLFAGLVGASSFLNWASKNRFAVSYSDGRYEWIQGAPGFERQVTGDIRRDAMYVGVGEMISRSGVIGECYIELREGGRIPLELQLDMIDSHREMRQLASLLQLPFAPEPKFALQHPEYAAFRVSSFSGRKVRNAV